MNSAAHHEEIINFLKQKTGWTLTKEESIKLYYKYVDPVSTEVNYKQLLQDLHEGVILKEKGKYLKNEFLLDPERHLSFLEIISWLRTELVERLTCLKGDNIEQKTRLLLGEKQAPLLTKPQLRTSLQLRLSVTLTDPELTEIFNVFDSHNSGFIAAKSLIDKLLEGIDTKAITQIAPPESVKSSNRTSRSTTATAGSRPGSKLGARKLKMPEARPATTSNTESRHAYDQRYMNLFPPDEKQCRYYSLEEIENIILVKIQERYPASQPFLQSLSYLFGADTSDVLPSISLSQMRYILWKKLKLNITDANVMAFYLKYSKDLQQPIPLQLLSRRMLKEDAIVDDYPPADERGRRSPSRRSRPVTRTLSLSATGTESKLDAFLWELRSHMNKLLQQEGRVAPHYLIHGTSRMTEIQAKNFFKHRLHLNLESFSERVIEKVFREYQVQKGLVDVKRMILEAMALLKQREEENKLPSPPDTSGGVEERKERSASDPHVDLKSVQIIVEQKENSSRDPPTSIVISNNSKWKPKPVTPEDLEQILAIKCQERCRNHHPHTMLRKLFRESDQETRYISKSRLLEVCTRLDILVAPADFDRFFAKHDRNNTGKLEVRELLRVLFPPVVVEAEVNPVLPKDEAVIKKEKLLAKVMSELTGRRHTVSSLTGPNHTRINTELLQGVEIVEEEPMIMSPTTQTPSTVIPPPLSENQSDHAESLVNALQALPTPKVAVVPATTPVPPQSPSSNPKASIDVSLVPELSVIPVELSPRRPATAPTSKVTGPSRKARQQQKQQLLTGTTNGTREVANTSSPPITTPAVENQNEVRPRPQTASASIRSSSKQYHQIPQRELQLSVSGLTSQSAQNSPRPETAPHPHYPQYRLDSQTDNNYHHNQQSLAVPTAKDDLSLVTDPLRLAEFDQTIQSNKKRRRASSAPPTRTFFEVKRGVEETKGYDNHARTGHTLKPYTVLNGTTLFYELQQVPVTPSSSSLRSTNRRNTSPISKGGGAIDMSEIWKAKTAVAKRFVDSANPQYLEIDPVRESLRDFYKYAERNQITTSGQYGIYLRSFRKASSQRKQLYEKQKKLTVTLNIRPPSATATSRRSSRSRSRSGSRSGTRSRTSSINQYQPQQYQTSHVKENGPSLPTTNDNPFNPEKMTIPQDGQK